MKKRVFNELRSIVYDNCGISLSESKVALVTARVNKRMRKLNLAEAEDYLSFLKSDRTGAELIQFLDVISTNTTYFFRESEHFQFLAEELKNWSAKGQRRFRLWSAASSSGEEPYSIAMVINETLKGPGYNVKLLATDISTDILAKAKAGSYDKERVAKIPRYLLTRYFQKVENEGRAEYVARAELKNLIAFRRLNLSSPPFPMKGPLDIVFCRNVMIYFDKIVRGRLVNDIHRLLKPGGFLIVGHSESLAGLDTPFKTVRPSIYVKK